MPLRNFLSSNFKCKCRTFPFAAESKESYVPNKLNL